MKSAYGYFENNLSQIRDEGLWKEERIIESAQKAWIEVEGGRRVLNLCANNYLGLSDDKRVKKAAADSLNQYGYGLSSVRFICGTQTIHKQLEKKISDFLKTEDTLLYSSCFDANGGLFETLLTSEDTVISDGLNHASIIDGIRLCKAKRAIYRNNNMEDLEQKLKEAGESRIRLIVTDGVFSMDGIIADLQGICKLAEAYDALVMVDDSHAVGVMGERGGGTPEYCGVTGKVDILTGTLGKALGGASGGYTSGSKAIIDLLRQRSRPYLFSNTLAPVITAASCKVLDILSEEEMAREQLKSNTIYFRKKMKEAGFHIIDGVHPIIPVMIFDEKKAGDMAEKLYQKGVYVVSFSYPVVPRGKARIRTQISAAHTREDLDFAIQAFMETQRAFR